MQFYKHFTEYIRVRIMCSVGARLFDFQMKDTRFLPRMPVN